MSRALTRGFYLVVLVLLLSFVSCTTTAPSITGVTGLPVSTPIGTSVVLTATGGPGSSSGLWYWKFSTTRNSSCGGLFTSTTTPNNGPADPITIGPTDATTVQVTYTGATPGPCTFTIELITSSGREATYVVSTTFMEGFTLTVTKAGTGSGTVASSPPGIDCGMTCVAGFAADSQVALTATPASDSTFDGWTGCDAIMGNQCTVTMDTDKFVTATFSPSCAGIVVNFPDPGLEQAVRDTIGKPTGDICDSDLITVTWLDASHRSISNLTGIEYMTNLTVLILVGNQISDISPLAGLTTLHDLLLGYNQISDLSPLAGLTNLNHLNLGDNQISDLSPLAGLTNMYDLSLDCNQISDISPLAGLTTLHDLTLSGNQISDLSPLAGLTNLNHLDLQGNQISDIAPLVANPGLGSGDDIWLQYNYLDLSPGNIDMVNIQTLQSRGVNVYYEPQYCAPGSCP